MSNGSALLRLAPVLVAGTFNTVGLVGHADRTISSERRVVATIDVAATPALFAAEGGNVGGMATRVELDEPGLNSGLSSWYRLAYVEGGARLQVFEHYFETAAIPQSDIVESQYAAWRFATEVIDGAHQPLPAGARIRTGQDYGSSAGLMFTLTYLDVLSPGALVGGLRVSGTGGIGADGRVLPVSHVEAKVAAALLTQPDVVFSPRASKLIGSAFAVPQSRPYSAGESVTEWLHLDAYRAAGNDAANHVGVTAFVVVHDVRQALAWLCGRTGDREVCDVAQHAASLPIPDGRSW